MKVCTESSRVTGWTFGRIPIGSVFALVHGGLCYIKSNSTCYVALGSGTRYSKEKPADPTVLYYPEACVELGKISDRP